MKHIFCVIIYTALAFGNSFAQIPEGYYSLASGKTGEELKYALHLIIKDHTVLSYSALWTAFQSTDDKPNGRVWDMYSDMPGQPPPYEFTFVTMQCGSYNGEGDCYNREHSFPKSWFNDESPMYSDLFHLYPTDGYVNGRRGNYPFGEVSSPKWTSLNGSKLGACSYPGYTGTVFEPINEYKGDFARSYFYMVTRYHNLVATWSSAMLNGTTYPAFSPWAKSMLLEWNKQDPVSQKEVDRNNDIYANFQHNRNPFIDHPEYAELIWGNATVEFRFTSTPITSAQVDKSYSYTITTSGGSGNVQIMAVSKPAWLSLSGTRGGQAVLSGTPAPANLGANGVVIEATDGSATIQQTFTINVTGNSTGGSTLAETFELMPAASSSYSGRTWVGDNGISWSATNARTDQSITNRAICFKNDQSSYLVSTELDGGCRRVQFKHQQKFTGSGGAITLYVNNAKVGESVPVSTTVQTATFTDLTFTGHFTIKLQSNGAARIAIDDLEWEQQGAANQPPLIGNVSIYPQNPYTSQPIDVSATIVDSDGTIAASWLQWGYSGHGVNSRLELLPEGDRYAATLPAQNDPGTILLTLFAVDNSSDTTTLDYSLQVQANYPPSISNITVSPSRPTTNQPITVSATISDAENNLSFAKLAWGTSETDLPVELIMSESVGLYTATIDGITPATTIYFKIYAEDELQASISSPVQPITIAEPNTPPVIESISISPASPTSSDDVTVTARVIDPEGEMGDVTLSWGLTQEANTHQATMGLADQQYAAMVPKQVAGSTVYYRVKAFDTHGLFAESSVYCYMVSEGTGIAVNTSGPGVSIFPNPVLNTMYVEVSGFAPETIEIWDALGQKVFANSYTHRIDICLDSGVYVVRLIGGSVIYSTVIVKK